MEVMMSELEMTTEAEIQTETEELAEELSDEALDREAGQALLCCPTSH